MRDFLFDMYLIWFTYYAEVFPETINSFLSITMKQFTLRWRSDHKSTKSWWCEIEKLFGTLTENTSKLIKFHRTFNNSFPQIKPPYILICPSDRCCFQAIVLIPIGLTNSIQIQLTLPNRNIVNSTKRFRGTSLRGNNSNIRSNVYGQKKNAIRPSAVEQRFFRATITFANIRILVYSGRDILYSSVTWQTRYHQTLSLLIRQMKKGFLNLQKKIWC